MAKAGGGELAMAQAPTVYETYVQQFRALEEHLRLPPWLQQMRREALGRFLGLGFPTARRGNEPWKYTDLRPLAATPFQEPPQEERSFPWRRFLPWSPGWDTVMVVAGVPRSWHVRPEGPWVGDLRRALAEAPQALEEHLARYAIYHDDAFAALNTALFQDLVVVMVPPGIAVRRPLHVAFVAPDAPLPYAQYPRLLVLLGRGARLVLVESYVGRAPGPYMTAAVTEVFLDEGASLEHYRLLLEEEAYHIGLLRMRQERDSHLRSLFFGRGCRIGRNDVRVELDGPGAEAYLWGLYVTQGQEHLDNYINIDHIKPHCTSRLIYRGILDGASHAIFGGTVYVRPGAVKTDAEQEDKNLLLSREAEVDSKPSLEIYADDVKCGHGAAAGALAQDALFYMRSRGLDEATATLLLIKGFAAAVLDEVRLPRLRTFLERATVAALPRLKTLP
jgi:Fe-S cluster assembly protein SufD